MSFDSKRRAVLLAGGAAALTTRARSAESKPITIIVPFSAGGSTDLVTRVIAQYASPIVGAPILVDNRTGGGGIVGWGTGARATPDGTNLITIELSYAIAAGLVKMPFDPSTAFHEILTAVKVPHVLVINPDVPAHTVQEFIALAKSQPGKMNYGSGGNGTNTHLAGELFKSIAGVSMVHVPYKGAGAVLTDLMSGQVQALITSIPTALPHIKTGKLRALMVTGAQRNPTLPDVPSAKESGMPKMDMDFWIGVAAPAATPKPIVDKLNRQFIEALNTPDARKKIDEMGLSMVGSTPAQADKLVASEIVRWSAVIKQANITAD